ncbi:MAG: hypothetical protein CFH19_01302 [Alphaproteobacteria bacterium MarineAlpha5_Bin9]|nr:MAG: hypothetical protein CFH19_01302 [Alphaproteobacteria bacterium MarineAlpha5_Bin9]|tara:strand:+ start:8558 stop:9826 length:1269 start_codon:yes stop_codon:yes gene_type:complete
MIYVFFYFKDNSKINISLFFLSVGISLYCFEIYLEYSKEKNYKMKIEEDKKLTQSILNFVEKNGLSYDNRTKIEVLNDLKKMGYNSFPNILPSFFLSNKSTVNGLDNLNEKIYPLGGISNITTILSNELGYYPIIQTDQYGFKNPENFYNEEIDIALIGDSYAEGSSVKENQNIASVLRSNELKTINFGMGGIGSLIEYAIFREYIIKLKPKNIVWLFCFNDFENLRKELNSDLLKKYIYDDNFSQNLITKQKMIDILLKQYAKKEKAKENQKNNAKISVEKNNIYSTFIIFIERFKLSNLRSLLKLNPIQNNNHDEIKKIIFDIISKTNESISMWEGKLFLVYIPKSLINGNSKDLKSIANREFISNLAEELNIPFLDLKKDVFSHLDDPLILLPFRLKGHYNEIGYKLISDEIIKMIEKN